MEHTSVKTDRRIIKTKKAIRTAFSRLLSEKECSDIKVTEIALAADINRKTFYNYYNSPEDVLAEIENDIAAIYERAAQGLDFNEVLTDPMSLYMYLHQSQFENSDLFKIMDSLGTNREFTNKIITTICEKATVDICRSCGRDEEKVKTACYFVGGGIVEALGEWNKSGKTISEEELSNLLIDFVTCVFKHVI